MVSPDRSRVVEDYVTLVWKSCEWPGGRASTSDLASRLGVTASTVSANLKRLAKAGLLDYEPYGSIALTDEGRAIATAIVHRHRIIESYLADELGLRWDEVHEEADRLEHAISDRLLERMDEMLDRPDFDPHGDPIPRDGRLPTLPDSVPLAEAPAGAECTVVRVADRHPEVLRYLSTKAIGLGIVLRVETPLDARGAMTVAISGGAHELSATAAAAVRVSVR